jgi:ubiquitin carboxyl-terminal hydrolase 25/28
VKAVKVIAMHRQSGSLNAWITSGFTSELSRDMDLGEAYHVMEITDRTMDDSTILTVYEIRKQEDPANADRFVRALSAIARERNSNILLSELQLATPERAKASLLEPVGLDNIGNTCYLNSLLQSLFTIRGVREVVLNFENYKMDTTAENMAVKRVGQRKLSVKEVEKAQKCKFCHCVFRSCN